MYTWMTVQFTNKQPLNFQTSFLETVQINIPNRRIVFKWLFRIFIVLWSNESLWKQFGSMALALKWDIKLISSMNTSLDICVGVSDVRNPSDPNQFLSVQFLVCTNFVWCCCQDVNQFLSVHTCQCDWFADVRTWKHGKPQSLSGTPSRSIFSSTINGQGGWLVKKWPSWVHSLLSVMGSHFDRFTSSVLCQLLQGITVLIIICQMFTFIQTKQLVPCNTEGGYNFLPGAMLSLLGVVCLVLKLRNIHIIWYSNH